MGSPDVLTASAPLNRSGGVAQRLVVAWQHPNTRSIQPVGFLTYDGESYRFTYIRNALRTQDFPPLLGFHDFHRSYRSTELFTLFAQRAMDSRRPDYHRYVERLGLEGDPGPWEQIARSEGRRHGDTLQLLPEPEIRDDVLTCLFLVHGIRHVHDTPKILGGREITVTRKQINAALTRFKPGDELVLAPEPGNPANPLALMVMGSLVPLGWVPDLLVADIHNLRRHTNVTVTVEHVNGPDAPWHLRLLARLRAMPADGYRFFTDEKWAPLANQ